MASRIIIGGREIGSGKLGAGQALCLCDQPVAILGRCVACHEALRRRRLGLAPADEAEKRRLAGYLERHAAALQRCHECGATPADPEHDRRCSFYGM